MGGDTADGKADLISESSSTSGISICISCQQGSPYINI